MTPAADEIGSFTAVKGNTQSQVRIRRVSGLTAFAAPDTAQVSLYATIRWY
jgi:hypothetical protein